MCPGTHYGVSFDVSKIPVDATAFLWLWFKIAVAVEPIKERDEKFNRVLDVRALIRDQF